MVKSHKIPTSTRRKIGKYKKDNPGVPIAEIAEKHNCSYAQARSAIEAYNSGKLGKPRGRGAGKKSKEEHEAESSSPDELFSMAYKKALVKLATSKSIDPAETVSLLEKMQKMALVTHLKRSDAGIIAQIIRRFLPEATDLEVIKIYREELELWKVK